MTASLLRELRNKLSSGSFSLRDSTQKDVSLSPDDEAMDDQLKAIIKAFKLRTLAELKIILSALILSECVYKLVDIGEQESAKAASGFTAQFPPGLVSLQHIQSANTTVPHRYMLGDDGQSLYVVFMGTKHMRDLLSDANFLQEAVWKSKDPDKQQQAGALAHRGFLARARHIPVEALYAHARSQGKSLVLCGHSLGGAVALLCTLRLLQGLAGSTPSLRCICFGTPAIGNAALAAVVAEYGWESHILNFILPEDIIPRMLALPAVPKPEKASPPAPDANPQQNTALQSQAAKSAASDPAAGAGAVRSRLQNLRAILTAHKADTQQAGAVLTQPAPQQVQQDDTAELSSSVPASVPTADATKVQGTAVAASTSVSSAESSQRPVLRSIRSIASRLPSFNRSQSLPDIPEKLPLGLLQPGDDHAQPSTESIPVSGSQEQPQPLESQTSEANQGPRMWGLQNRVQGVWLGASNRVKALRSLLPAYPAYVHIGSHQILLPASPAMSKALKDAQQQGLAEERQQALNMHRMSAYRGRAIAICRSVFQWASADTPPQISLSTTLAPPITLIHSSVIVPPLPIPGILSTNQAEQSSQTTNRAVLAKQQAPLPQPPIPRKAATLAQVAGDPNQQRQLPHSPVLAAAKHAEPVPHMAKPAAPVSQQRVQPGSKQIHSGQPSTVQPEPYTQDQQSNSAAAQLITASVQSQAVASPKQWRWQWSSTSSQQAPAQGTGLAAGMPGSAQGFLGQVLEPEVTPQAQHQAPAVDQTAPSRSAIGGVTEARPSRWLPPVGVRWQGGKQKSPPKAVVRIHVQGSLHSMPVRAQLHVMGQTWCKARLLPSSTLQHRAPTEHQSGNTSWRQSLMQRLPWLRLQPVERQHAQQGVLFFQAEVPVALLHAIVDDTPQQLRDQQQQNWDEKYPSSRALQAPQKQDVELPTEQPAMLLRLQTDFQTREQAVQVQLPVVWLLGTDPPASQAVWQMLIAAQQQPNQKSTAHSNLPEDGKAGSAWQSAQQKFRRALSMVQRREASGQLQQQQPQLETAVMSGVRYAHIQATRMQAVDMLSCLLMLLTQFTRDSVAAGPMQLEGSLQRLPARLRAVYHRQELQYLQSQLRDLGPPSGVLLANGGLVELKLSHAIALLMKQANVMGIMRLGVTLSRGAHIGSEGLLSIPSDDWVELPRQSGSARAETLVVGLQQRLRNALTAVVSGLSSHLSKL